MNVISGRALVVGASAAAVLAVALLYGLRPDRADVGGSGGTSPPRSPVETVSPPLQGAANEARPPAEAAPPAAPGPDEAVLSGLVVDVRGAPCAGATIELARSAPIELVERRHVLRRAVSGPDGAWRIPLGEGERSESLNVCAVSGSAASPILGLPPESRDGMDGLLLELLDTVEVVVALETESGPLRRAGVQVGVASGTRIGLAPERTAETDAAGEARLQAPPGLVTAVAFLGGGLVPGRVATISPAGGRIAVRVPVETREIAVAVAGLGADAPSVSARLFVDGFHYLFQLTADTPAIVRTLDSGWTGVTRLELDVSAERRLRFEWPTLEQAAPGGRIAVRLPPTDAVLRVLLVAAGTNAALPRWSGVLRQVDGRAVADVATDSEGLLAADVPEGSYRLHRGNWVSQPLPTRTDPSAPPIVLAMAGWSPLTGACTGWRFDSGPSRARRVWLRIESDTPRYDAPASRPPGSPPEGRGSLRTSHVIMLDSNPWSVSVPWAPGTLLHLVPEFEFEAIGPEVAATSGGSAVTLTCRADARTVILRPTRGGRRVTQGTLKLEREAGPDGTANPGGRGRLGSIDAIRGEAALPAVFPGRYRVTCRTGSVGDGPPLEAGRIVVPADATADLTFDVEVAP